MQKVFTSNIFKYRSAEKTLRIKGFWHFFTSNIFPNIELTSEERELFIHLLEKRMDIHPDAMDKKE